MDEIERELCMSTRGPYYRDDISPYVRTSLRKLALPEPQWALDLACGTGRHSLSLASLGYSVTCADISADYLLALQRRAPRAFGTRLHPVQMDATKTLPFLDEAFGLVVISDFWQPGLLRCVSRVMSENGILIFHTYGGHGENWRALPTVGQLESESRLVGEALHYRERPVGPRHQRRVAVKAVLRRRKSQQSRRGHASGTPASTV